MRKQQKKTAENFVRLLGQARTEIKKEVENGNIEQALDLIGQCQQGAIQLGQFIEAYEGENFVTVNLLENYCEQLYQIFTAFTESESVPPANLNRLFKVLKKQLISVENSIKADIPERIEVVFLPYKKAMADSLQTVWEAAMNDPDCDVHICPIPYYDKNPDGSFGKMHYEGDQYPADLPLVDWRKYDIENRRPDIIFVHAPYDNQNYVTSVHPSFYCERLKRLTNFLVYIPYFICSNNIGEYLCSIPGTIFADLIPVQSKKIREVYIKTFRQFEQDNHCRGLFGNPDQKFIALGSPKIDVASSKKASDYDIPAEWKSFLYKENGMRKTVILFNTTLSAMLKYDVDYLKKVRRTFDAFQEYEDIALWWRPHPLNEATFSSMRPQLAETYQQMISDYKHKRTGIYDDTSDMNRAVAMCDAYYGDTSSMLASAWAARKPMMQRMPRKYYEYTGPRNADFMDGIFEPWKGSKRVVLRECAKYHLHDFLKDVMDPDKKAKLLSFMDGYFNVIVQEQYANFGNSGQVIYDTSRRMALKKIDSLT